MIALSLATTALPGSAAADASDSTYAGTDLRTSTASPWNPPSPVHAAEIWETGLRLPLLIASYPLVLMGSVAERGLIRAEDDALVPRTLLLLAAQRRLGITLVPASLGDGTGIGAEVGWSPPLLAHHLLGAVSATTQEYDRARAVATWGPLQASYVSDWRPREPYFGTGISTPHSDESAYGERSQSAKLSASWAWQRDDAANVQGPQSPTILDSLQARGSIPGTQLSAWAGPRDVLETTGRDPDSPSIELVHPADAAGSLYRRVEHLVYGIGISHDARSGHPHWTRGWRASVEAERYDKSIEALAIQDAHTGARSFTRVTYRAETGRSFGIDPRTLRLGIKMVDQTLDAGGGAFPISSLVSLGGSTLAGFEPGRFQDLDLLLAKLTYIFPLGKNLEFDMHAETGGVYPNLGATRIGTFENSFGAALRLRTDLAVFGAVGMDWSREAARLRFSIGGIE